MLFQQRSQLQQVSLQTTAQHTSTTSDLTNTTESIWGRSPIQEKATTSSQWPNVDSVWEQSNSKYVICMQAYISMSIESNTCAQAHTHIQTHVRPVIGWLPVFSPPFIGPPTFFSFLCIAAMALIHNYSIESYISLSLWVLMITLLIYCYPFSSQEELIRLKQQQEQETRRMEKKKERERQKKAEEEQRKKEEAQRR